MIQQLNNIFELILKSLSILFSLFLSIGTVVIWIYLNKHNIGIEITELIGEPPILFTIALVAISISVFILLTFLFIPATIRFCRNNTEFQWSNPAPTKMEAYYFLIPMIPLSVIMIEGIINVETTYYTIEIFSISGLLSAMFYKIHEQPVVPDGVSSIFIKAKCFFLLYFSFLFVSIMMVYTMLFLSKITTTIFHNDILQWMVFIFISIGCSFFISHAACNDGYQSFFPIIIFATLSAIILLSGNVSDKIASKLGIGGYTKSFSIESKYLDGIPNAKDYKIEITQNSNIKVIKNAWVLADLPSKLIIKSSSDSSQKYVIPRGAVLSELE